MTKKIRFRASKGDGFQLPPEGTFDLQIVDLDPDKTSKDNDPQVVVQFEIAEGEHSGKKFRQFYTLNEERGWAFRKLCEVAGLDVQNESDDADADFGEFEIDVDDLRERYIRATIELNTNPQTKKTYVNLRDEQPSELQDAAEGDDGAGEPEDDVPADNGKAAPPPSARRRRPPAEA